MIRIFDAPAATPDTKFNDNAVGALNYYLQFGERNGSFQAADFGDTVKQSTAAALVTAGTNTIWTPAALNVIQLQVLQISVVVAGSWRIQYNGVTIFDLLLPANSTQTIFSYFPGIFLYPVNAPLNVQNNTGSTSLVAVTALGAELPG